MGRYGRRTSECPTTRSGRSARVTKSTSPRTAHWVKALICDPLAKHFIRNGVLNDYSVGISNPDFRYRDRKLDPRGQGAPDHHRQAGRFHCRMAELSVCDRGSQLQLRVSHRQERRRRVHRPDGRRRGRDRQGRPGRLLTKAAHDDDTVNVDVPKSATITFSPATCQAAGPPGAGRGPRGRRLKAVLAAESAAYKRDIDVATRRRLLAQGRALPGEPPSYPIETHEDAGNAVTLALSGHGDVAAAKKLIRRIASKEGWQDILDRLDGKTSDDAEKAATCGTCHGSGKITDGNLDCPDCDGRRLRTMTPGRTPLPSWPRPTRRGRRRGRQRAGGGALHHDDGAGRRHRLRRRRDGQGRRGQGRRARTMTKPPKMPCPACKKMNKPKAKFCGKCGAP